MPKVLRVVKGAPLWMNRNPLPWIGQGDIAADYLRDFHTKDNKLSLWKVEEDRSNLDRTIAAYVSMWSRPDNFSCLLFPTEVLDHLTLIREPQPGNTQDEVANFWHFNLVELTGSKIVALVRNILDSEYDIVIRDIEELSNSLAHSVQAEHIPFRKLSKPWQEHLNRRLGQQGLL
ncbi:MAG: hypothetical protein AB1791_17835 [Chloroflexota bacterium]